MIKKRPLPPALPEEYLRECIKAGTYEVRIVHGKGTGYQCKMVHSFLEKSSPHTFLLLGPPAFCGCGAIIIPWHKAWLK